MPPRREVLWIKAGKKCHWCGVATRLRPTNPDGSPLHAWDMATKDHVIPRHRGGTDDEENLVSACALCNNRRSHEDSCGLPDGSMLGKYHPDKGMLYRGQKKMVCLTADDKKALMTKMSAKTAEDILREQRDQALAAVSLVRKEMKHWETVVVQQEELLKNMTIWKLIKRRLREWLKD